MSSKRPLSTKAGVKKKIQEILAYHDRGRESHALPPGVTIEQQAAGLGWSETTLRKARQFAHPTTGHTQDRLDELCDLMREHRPVFGTSHIGQLVTVPDWEDREELQRQCVENNWSLRELRSAKAKLFAPRSHGGRRPHVRPDDVLDRLEKFAHAFGRLLGELKRSSKGQPAIIAGLPKDVRAWAKAAAPHLEKLRDAVIAKMEAIRAGG